MKVWSSSLCTIFDTSITYNLPGDVVELGIDIYEELRDALSRGMTLSVGPSGEPVTVEQIPVGRTDEEIVSARRFAYADPESGSDRYFSKAVRLDAMGESGADVERQKGVARYLEIKESLPYGGDV